MTQGPTKIPPQHIPGPSAPAQGLPQAPPVKPSPNVVLEKLPPELSEVRTITRVKGEVVRDNRDGTLQIKTEKGEIQVRAENRELNIRQGDRVDVEIPPGRPPRTATVIREAQAPPASPRTTQTPVDVEVRPAETVPPRAPEPQPAPVPATLREGQVVRLEPVPRNDTQNYTPLPATTAIAEILDHFIFTPITITQDNPQDFILAQIANTFPSPVHTATGNMLPYISQPAPPFLQNSFPGIITTSFTADISKPLFVPLMTDSAAARISIPSQGSTLPLPDLAAFSLTVQPQTTAPLLENIADNLPMSLRAEVASVAQNISPAILTPKIPPSPFIAPGALMQNFEKPAILQNHRAEEIPAIVTGRTPQNLPVIGMISPTTGEDMFFIMHINDGTVVPGTQISLIPQQPVAHNITSARLMATPGLAPAPSYFLVPESWPLMNDIYQALAQLMPRSAQAMSAMTPSPNTPAQIGPAALFFIAAVRGGDFTQWLGSNSTDALRRGGKSGLLERLGLEGSTLSKLAADNVSGEWRAMPLPLMWDNQMHKIALYYKNDSQHEQNNPEGRQHRFIFDLSLDAMGPVQIDGLFRAQRLNLIVRAKEPFSSAMQTEMRRIYAGALGKTSITGDLSFQNRPDQWVTITPDKKNIGVSI